MKITYKNKITNIQLYIIASICLLFALIVLFNRFNDIMAEGYVRDLTMACIAICIAIPCASIAFNREDNERYGNYPITTKKLVEDFGFEQSPDTLENSCYISVIGDDDVPDTRKDLIITSLREMQFVVTISDGKLSEDRSKDHFIILKTGITQMSDIMTIYKYITGNQLVKVKNNK